MPITAEHGERRREASLTDEQRRQAATALLERYDARLRRTARRFSLCAADAEDAYQRAIEILLRKAPVTDPERLVRWMHTVTRHEAYAVRRQREKLLDRPVGAPEEGPELDPIDLLPHDGPEPTEGVARKERVVRSFEALKALKPQELRTLTLKAEGYSYVEIEEITGFSQTKLNRRVAARGAERDTARAMSEENVEVVQGVRTPVTVRSKTRRRTLDERLIVRFPALVRVILSAWSRLPPRSRLRRTLLSRYMRQGCEAANRRDFDLLFVFYDPEIELKFDESPVDGFVPPDLRGVNRGHEAHRRVWEAMIETMEDFRIELDDVIDFGDRLLNTARVMGHGSASGVPVSQPLFQVFTLRRGFVIRQEEFVDRDKALEAAGLSE